MYVKNKFFKVISILYSCLLWQQYFVLVLLVSVEIKYVVDFGLFDICCMYEAHMSSCSP